MSIKLPPFFKKHWLLFLLLPFTVALGYFTFPYILGSESLRFGLVIFFFSVPLVYFLNVLSLKHKSEFLSLISFLIVLFIGGFLFSTLWSEGDFSRDIYWFYFVLSTFLNAGVVFHNTNDVEGTDIDVLLETFWVGVIGASFLLGTRFAIAMITDSLQMPWEEIALNRKFFFVFRMSYYFMLFLVAWKTWSSYKKKASINPLVISVLVALFIFYLSYSNYLFNTSDYLAGRLVEFVRECLGYLMLSTILIYIFQLYMASNKGELNAEVSKLYKRLFLFFSIVTIIPWLLLIISSNIESLSNFINSKQESLGVIVISSILTSVVSNLVVKYYTSKS